MTSEPTKAYIAGIVDGEGWVSLVTSAGKRRRKYKTATVVVVNTNYKMLLFLKKNYKGAFTKRKVLSPKHNQSWAWRVTAANARQLLRDIRPYLIIKAEQADRALAYYKEY